MLSDELKRNLKENTYVQEYFRYVADKILSLDTVQDLGKASVKRAGETVKARALAIKILQEILSPIVDFSEKREPTEKEIELAKKKAGL